MADSFTIGGPTAPILSAATGAAQFAAGSTIPKPANAKDAATQFEGLLIAEMLRSVRASNPDGLDGDGDDSQNSTLFDIAGEQFAQMLAKQGGFGIAKMVTSGISHQVDTTATPESAE